MLAEEVKQRQEEQKNHGDQQINQNVVESIDNQIGKRMDSDEMSLGGIERELNESENARKKEEEKSKAQNNLSMQLNIVNQSQS